MKHFGKDNVKHPNVFKESTATDVVTGILYSVYLLFSTGTGKEKKTLEMYKETCMGE